MDNKALDATLQILDLVIAGSITTIKLQQLRSQIEGMVTPGRDPTDEEWSALFSDLDKESSDLAAADRRLNP